ncbi:hypothetical protein M9458_035946 [Cirrhinus mrigala]|uniref:Leptin n=1 Tax=Cirrhinus mrigala TaxID=683832 RepID=A0ABD0P122_CIRMR
MYFPALLYLCILSVLGLVHGIPIHQDNLKNLVKLQADTIILRIKDHSEKLISSKVDIGHPELYPELPADKQGLIQAIQGLRSIMDTLTTFQKGHAGQIRNDLSTLLGYLKERMTSMHCTPKEPARSLDTLLEKKAAHPITFGYLVLDRLKQFMQKLINNLDQLKSC